MFITRSRRLMSAVAVAALAGSALVASAAAPATAEPIPTGSISGTVVGPDGVGIPNASIEAIGTTGWGAGMTGPSGEFVIRNMKAGNYKVKFSAGGYDSEYYLDADESSATAVGVGTTNVALQAAVLAVAAPTQTPDANTDVTGVVTDGATGKPIYGIFVGGYDAATGAWLDYAITDSAGTYELDDLDGAAAVKLSFDDDHSGGADFPYLSVWSGGVKAKPAATAVTLTPGTAVSFPAQLTRTAGINGRVLNPAGAVPYGAVADLYDMDGGYVASRWIRGDGGYSVGGLTPGQSYKVRFTSGYDYVGNDDANAEHYYLDTWYGGNDFASAAVVAAGSTGINGTFQDSLTAFEAPAVTGEHVIGTTLTGTAGRWNKSADSTFKLEWMRGSIIAGTGSTYQLTAADAGQPIALRVTNTNVDQRTGEVRTVSATTTPTVAKYVAKVTATSKKLKKGKKAGSTEVTVSVTSAGQAADKVTGTVTLTEGKKKVATISVNKGEATLVLKPKSAKPGKHRFAVSYSGNGTTLAADAEVTVKVKAAKDKKGKGKKGNKGKGGKGKR